MALKIRLRQQGRKNLRVYRLVLTDSRSPRDGKYIETLGWYNPYESEAEKSLKVEGERVKHWLDLGAVLSEKAEKLVKQGAPQVIEALREKQAAARMKVCAKKRALRKRKETATA